MFATGVWPAGCPSIHTSAPGRALIDSEPKPGAEIRPAGLAMLSCGVEVTGGRAADAWPRAADVCPRAADVCPLLTAVVVRLGVVVARAAGGVMRPGVAPEPAVATFRAAGGAVGAGAAAGGGAAARAAAGAAGLRGAGIGLRNS